jgi:hypothetical protein
MNLVELQTKGNLMGPKGEVRKTFLNNNMDNKKRKIVKDAVGGCGKGGPGDILKKIGEGVNYAKAAVGSSVKTMPENTGAALGSAVGTVKRMGDKFRQGFKTGEFAGKTGGTIHPATIVPKKPFKPYSTYNRSEPGPLRGISQKELDLRKKTGASTTGFIVNRE